MNNKRIKYLIYISFISTFCISRAFIYDISVMRKWDRVNSHYCYFVGLGDFHDKNHEITSLQINQLDKLVQRCIPEKTKFIFEDISSEGFSGKKSCGRFYINANGGILGGLTNKYRKKGIEDIDNVEYRFCRVVSLAPVVKNIDSDCALFLSTRMVNVHCFRDEILEVSKEILEYKDCLVLNDWYKKCVDQAINGMKVLKFESMSKMNIADYIYSNVGNVQNDGSKKRLNFIKKLLTFDSCLIDARIVHSIVNSSNKQNALVIAGGSHIRNVSRVLQSIGYKPVYRSEVLFNHESDVKNCLDSHVAPAGFCHKPKPADLQMVKRFI